MSHPFRDPDLTNDDFNRICSQQISFLAPDFIFETYWPANCV